MPDLILFNANVITMDSAMPRAQALAVRDGVIVEVSADGCLAFEADRDATTIDCHGKTVLPGFIDAHCHVASYAESLIALDLSRREEVTSISDVQERLRGLATTRPTGTWIRGKRYNEFHLAEQRHPNRWDLDAAAPHHPVKLTHRSGHAHVLSSLALDFVGITAETGDPPGGLIDRDLRTGEPTGILFGMAGFLSGKIPSIAEAELNKGLRLASERFLSLGITSVMDASSHNGIHHWEHFADWKARQIFLPRLMMMMGMEGFAVWKDRPRTAGEQQKGPPVGGVKVMVDQVTGSISPRQDELNAAVKAIHQAGYQLAMHAIDEMTIEAACNAIEYALGETPAVGHRHRIEHCSVCPPRLLERIRRLRIMVVTQPSFIYYSGDRYLATVPEEEQAHLYRIGAMVKKGVAVAGSSDCPVADPDPFVGMYAAVTRRTERGKELLPREALSPHEAIGMYTSAAAFVCGEETTKGSICRGKVADLVIVNENPLEVDVEDLRLVKPEMTILGGEVVWCRPEVG